MGINWAPCMNDEVKVGDQVLIVATVCEVPEGDGEVYKLITKNEGTIVYSPRRELFHVKRAGDTEAKVMHWRGVAVDE